MTTAEIRAVAVLDDLRASPEIAALDRQWSECMAEGGYAYRTPFEPFAAPWTGNRPTEDEVRTALADVACKEELGYLDVVQARLAASLSEQGDAVSEVLAELSELSTEIVANAEAALGG